MVVSCCGTLIEVFLFENLIAILLFLYNNFKMLPIKTVSANEVCQFSVELFDFKVLFLRSTTLNIFLKLKASEIEIKNMIRSKLFIKILQINYARM